MLLARRSCLVQVAQSLELDGGGVASELAGALLPAFHLTLEGRVLDGPASQANLGARWIIEVSDSTGLEPCIRVSHGG